MKKHPIIFSVIAFNIILLLIVFIIFLVQNSRTALLDVVVTPTDSKITLNGQEIQNFQTHKFTPGHYIASISKDGFDAKEITLKLEPDTTTKLHTYLTQDNNLNYYISNTNDRVILERNNNQDVQNFIEQYQKITSIKNILPIYQTEYKGQEISKDIKITQTRLSDCPTYVCLLVTSIFPVTQNDINDLIKEKGYDPQNYHFDYKIY